MSSITRPMLEDRCRRRSVRAMSLGRQPSVSIAFLTRAAVSMPTPGSSFTTRDTVLRLTSAALATSHMVERVLVGLEVLLFDNVVKRKHNGYPHVKGLLASVHRKHERQVYPCRR